MVNWREETKDVQKAIKQLQQENKILKENAENNDKVVDKVNWENQKLKKELEEYKTLGFEHLNDKCNKLENQQKEFISYLENKIKEPVGYNLLYDNKQQAYKEILSKYNEKYLTLLV